MSSLDEMREFIEQKGIELLGKEGMEQMEKDQEWLEENFKDVIQAELMATMLAMAFGKQPIELALGSFTNGMMVYRHFITSKGVDVLALEGRA